MRLKLLKMVNKMKSNPLKPGWKMVKFGEVVKNANLVERDPETNGVERIVGLEHIDPENLHVRRWNSVADGTSFTRKFVPGQTLFGKRRAYQRKVAFAEFEGICSGDILTFEPKNRKVLLSELLPFICQSDAFFDHALDTSAGSLSPRTSWTALKDFEFPLPPLDEQKRIAEILWAADEAVEKWLGIVSELKALIDRMRDGHFSAPDNGRSAPLGEWTELITKGESPRWQGFEYIDSGVLFVTSENVLFGEYSPQPTKHIPPDFHEKLKRSQLKQRDVLVNLVGASIGRACVFDSDCEANINQAVALIRCNTKSLIPEYVLSFLLAPSNLRKLVGGSVNTARANISLTQLRDLRLPKIDVGDQKEFCRTIGKITEGIDRAQNQIEKLSSLSKAVISGVSHV